MNRLSACRVCLAYNTRLCSLMDDQLRDIYEKVVETSLDTEDMLPTKACYICFAFMKKIQKFRDRSQKANQIMQQIINSGLEPSVSSLEKLVKGQTGISWTLGISAVERTTSCEVEVKVKIESVKSEMDIDGMSDWNEDYSDSMPAYRESTSDFENLPLQNSEQCNTDCVKIEKTLMVQLEKNSGHEGAALPKKRKFDKDEAENEVANLEIPLRKTEKDKEPGEKKEEKKQIPPFKKGSKRINSSLKRDTETTTSNIISGKQNDSAFNENDTDTPTKDILTCDLCKNEYQCKTLLESHMKSSHMIDLNRKDSIDSVLNVTNECKSTNLLKVKEIQNNDNRKENDRRENKCRDKTNQFECQYCMKRFINNFILTNHIRVHTKEKPFKCGICGKCFSERVNLTRHLRVHTKEKPFKCAKCGKSFSLSCNLTAHLRVHSKEKPFKCDICEKSFTESRSLTRHLRVHTKEKPFKCDICGKCFSVSYHLTSHLRVHTKEKPFKCDKCVKRFSDRSNLTKHLKVHTKDKPFKCHLSEKCLSESGTLISHLRVHTKEKPFKCDVCGKCKCEISD